MLLSPRFLETGLSAIGETFHQLESLKSSEQITRQQGASSFAKSNLYFKILFLPFNTLQHSCRPFNDQRLRDLSYLRFNYRSPTNYLSITSVCVHEMNMV